MADIVAAAAKMNDVEVAQDGPLTENLMNKLGANINYLLDLGIQVMTFNSGAAFTCPDGINHAIVIGCGGGMGGASSDSGINALGGYGAMGQVCYVAMTPGAAYLVTIGAGGVGATYSAGLFVAGGWGNNTQFLGPGAGLTFSLATVTPTKSTGNTGGLIATKFDGYDSVTTPNGIGGTAGYFGNGGYGTNGTTAESAAANSGGGGGGAIAANGGNGGSGKLILILFK